MAGPTKGRIDDIELDAVLSVRHRGPVEVTKHPIEQGADPTDHARELPEQVTIEGFVTNAPLEQAARDARGETEPRASGYAQQVEAKLRRLKSSRRAVALRTARRSYENMVLVDLVVPEDVGLGDALQFTASFEQVRFVRNEAVRLEQVSRPTSVPKKPSGKVEQGKKPGADAGGRTTILKQLANEAGLTAPGSGVAP